MPGVPKDSRPSHVNRSFHPLWANGTTLEGVKAYIIRIHKEWILLKKILFCPQTKEDLQKATKGVNPRSGSIYCFVSSCLHIMTIELHRRCAYGAVRHT